VVIQIGDRTVIAQRLVVVENRRVKERVPIHRLPMAGRTAADWDPKAQPGNATIRRVKVRQNFFGFTLCNILTGGHGGN